MRSRKNITLTMKLSKSVIAALRLFQQHITQRTFTTPEQLLSYMCAMQAQDYVQAKWAIGLRLSKINDTDIEHAISQKKIVRTWAMRGTLQFVAAKDYRWIHDLLSHKFHSINTARNKQLELDAKIFTKANALITGSLEKEKLLTRNEIGKVLNLNGIKTDQNRLSHILHFATMHQLICFGPRRENEFTFVLLDDWVPAIRRFSREKSLSKIAKQFFLSRGPATFKDFIWWSGLSVTEARNALEMVKHLFNEEIFNGEMFYFSKALMNFKDPLKLSKKIILLAAFDEYLIGYTNRSAVLDPKYNANAVHSNGIFHPTIVLNGQVIGIWRPILKGKNMTMRMELFEKVSKQQQQLIEKEFERYCTLAKTMERS